MDEKMERRLNAIAKDITKYADLQEEYFVGEILSEPINLIELKMMYLLGKICEKGKVELLRRLIVDGIDVNMENGYALRTASWHGNRECVELLIRAGADVSVGQNYSIRMAHKNGHKEVEEILRNAGAVLEL